ncbi:hypothetical protein, partial [Bradyrhizobium sp. NBAIM08]|uniref:hypothetical protein n=1 Tax=Bradyrhizobium sp. NBAIM08 TaxID=2793815 RepID=UPI001CD22FA9
IVDNRICASGERLRVITDGVLQIVEQRESEDGDFVFVVEATSLDGTPLKRATVTPAELETAEWIARHFGAGVVLHGRPQELRSALLSLAKDDVVVLLTRTGFVKTARGLGYVHASGTIGAVGATVRTEFTDPLDHYLLP